MEQHQVWIKSHNLQVRIKSNIFTHQKTFPISRPDLLSRLCQIKWTQTLPEGNEHKMETTILWKFSWFSIIYLSSFTSFFKFTGLILSSTNYR